MTDVTRYAHYQKGASEPLEVVAASDYDALRARLAWAEKLLQEVWDEVGEEQDWGDGSQREKTFEAVYAFLASTTDNGHLTAHRLIANKGRG